MVVVGATAADVEVDGGGVVRGVAEDEAGGGVVDGVAGCVVEVGATVLDGVASTDDDGVGVASAEDVASPDVTDVVTDDDVSDGPVTDVVSDGGGVRTALGSMLTAGNVGSGAPGATVAAGFCASTLTVSSCHCETSSALR